MLIFCTLKYCISIYTGTALCFIFMCWREVERNVQIVHWVCSQAINFINVLQIVLKNGKNDGKMLCRESIVVSRIKYRKVKWKIFNIQYVLLYYRVKKSESTWIKKHPHFFQADSNLNQRISMIRSSKTYLTFRSLVSIYLFII